MSRTSLTNPPFVSSEVETQGAAYGVSTSLDTNGCVLVFESEQ